VEIKVYHILYVWTPPVGVRTAPFDEILQGGYTGAVSFGFLRSIVAEHLLRLVLLFEYEFCM